MPKKYTVAVDENEPQMANILGLAVFVAAYTTEAVPIEAVEKAMDMPIGDSVQLGRLFIARVEET